jgi:hypothetical protein
MKKYKFGDKVILNKHTLDTLIDYSRNTGVNYKTVGTIVKGSFIEGCVLVHFQTKKCNIESHFQPKNLVPFDESEVHQHPHTKAFK